MLWENIERRMETGVLLLEHAEVKGLSNVKKSSYLRGAILVFATVIEGLVYELVKKKTAHPHIIFSDTTHKERHRIPGSAIGHANDHCICEKVTKDVLIDDDGVTFAKLNLYLKHHKIITTREYDHLNWVRKQRNKLHLQGLNTPDTGYTRAKITRLATAMQILLNKL